MEIIKLEYRCGITEYRVDGKKVDIKIGEELCKNLEGKSIKFSNTTMTVYK